MSTKNPNYNKLSKAASSLDTLAFLLLRKKRQSEQKKENRDRSQSVERRDATRAGESDLVYGRASLKSLPELADTRAG